MDKQEMLDTIGKLSPRTLWYGIAVHREHKWPEDFHAYFYCRLEYFKCNGLNEAWWNNMQKPLRGWRATRNPQNNIEKTGLKMLKKLSEEYDKILQQSPTPSIESCDWDSVSKLFGYAHEIKGVQNPTFGSKLCHFILPAAFPIFDNTALALVPPQKATVKVYEDYWNVCKQRWQECERKEDLKDILRHEIQIGDYLSDSEYPWAAKISGLCAMQEDI